MRMIRTDYWPNGSISTNTIPPRQFKSRTSPISIQPQQLVVVLAGQDFVGVKEAEAITYTTPRRSPGGNYRGSRACGVADGAAPGGAIWDEDLETLSETSPHVQIPQATYPPVQEQNRLSPDEPRVVRGHPFLNSPKK